MTLQPGLTVIVHTGNSAATLDNCLASVQDWADEILVVDQQSTDETLKIAKKAGARILAQPKIGYVEPSRQIALDSVTTEWTLILDADEELPATGRQNFSTLLQAPPADIFAVPRKNLIFGQWAQGGWWPDYQIRLFRTGTVTWPPELHAKPVLASAAYELPPEEKWALLHHNYTDIRSFVERELRYSQIALQEVGKGKRSIADHPLQSYLQDFILWHYARDGKKGGSHELTLSSLQAFFEVLVLTQLWEQQKFPMVKTMSVDQILDQAADDAFYWEMHERWLTAKGWEKWVYRLRMKLRV